MAESNDLVNWKPKGLVMGFGKEGAFDHGGVTFGGSLFTSYDLDKIGKLKKYNGKYYALYGCYRHQGGYELGPGAEGAAWSDDGIKWHRVPEDKPILSIEGAADWEKDTIYQPWLLEHEGKFYNFYNAYGSGRGQIGVAFSNDIINWQRHADNPILKPGGSSYDSAWCSDPKVFRDGDHWVMIYFGVGGGEHIMIAFSPDLLHWTAHPEPLYKAGGHPSGLDTTAALKVSLIYNPKNDTYYMFYCAVGNKGRGIGLVTSKPLAKKP
jgi:sucrose-6-phosphate hydrolase SacC (GH32 family)